MDVGGCSVGSGMLIGVSGDTGHRSLTGLQVAGMRCGASLGRFCHFARGLGSATC